MTTTTPLVTPSEIKEALLERALALTISWQEDRLTYGMLYLQLTRAGEYPLLQRMAMQLFWATLLEYWHPESIEPLEELERMLGENLQGTQVSPEAFYKATLAYYGEKILFPRTSDTELGQSFYQYLGLDYPWNEEENVGE